MDKDTGVNATEADPKVVKPRARSGVSFPYWDLNSAVEVAKVMHERAGGTCDNAQLAAMLGYSGVSNGSFRTRVSSAKMFGLIEETEDRKLRVSARGRMIVAPVTPMDGRSARVDAFLSVDLFKRVFEQYDGMTLPETVGLRNLIQHQFQVVQDRVAPTVRILLDSAQQAGLFDTSGNRSRMTRPVGAVPSVTTPPQLSPPPRVEGSRDLGRRRNDMIGVQDEGDGGIDPAILGLLRRLPPGGSPMSSKRRKALIDAFTNVVGFIYPDAEEGD